MLFVFVFVHVFVFVVAAGAKAGRGLRQRGKHPPHRDLESGSVASTITQKTVTRLALCMLCHHYLLFTLFLLIIISKKDKKAGVPVHWSLADDDLAAG